MNPLYQRTGSYTQRLGAALAYARKGIPVFPLKPGTKEPLHGSRGFYDATTDEEQIRRWWSALPDANIGIPTGERSGLLVLDVDTDRWGAGTLDALIQKHGELPDTTTAQTGGGGQHYYMRYPASETVRNSADKLGPGLDVRGEGGYVVAPGSFTQGPYEWLERLPLAEAPEWLLEAQRERQGAVAGERRTASTPAANLDGGPIPKGARNDTLTRIAGRLHDGSRNLDELARQLLAVNEARCEPPLPEPEVLGIARSIHARTPCKAAPGVTPEVLALVVRLEELSRSRPKKGMGGHSNWAVYRALLDLAKRVGREHPDGVEVSIAVRTLALAAGVGLGTVIRALERLTNRGLVVRSRSGGGERSGALVLIGSVVEHSSTGGGTTTECSTLTPIRTLYRLRWGPGRIGKSRAAILEALAECSGGSRAELARSLRRKPDALKKPLRWLLDAGLVVRTGHGRYELAPDFAERLAEWRETGEEPEADRRDVRRYNENQRAYRNRYKVRPERAPTSREMEERRDNYRARRRAAIEEALARLFAQRPELRTRRAGQIVCALRLPPDFPRGPDGHPKDHEVEAILDGVAA